MVGTFKPKGNSSEWEWKKAVEETEVSMYITNFPPHINSKHLRKICSGVGTVADVYLPRKLSNSGKRFAFVRFLLRLQDDDVSELARRLSAIWIGNYHLFATLARHQKKPFHQSQTRHKEVKIVLEEDRISALPDNLLIEILSRLPSTKHAITTGTLSKRWKHLWTWLPTLIFYDDKMRIPLSNYYSSVDKTITQCRCLKLKKFQVYIYYDYHDTEFKFVSHFKNWLRYAISCNVEELNISCEGRLHEFMLDQFFFTGSCFTKMRIAGFTMKPTGASSWNRLMSLSISNVTLDEDAIENILSGTPLLETLELDDCHGYRQLNITSKSIKNLVLSRNWGVYKPYISHIIAPNILSLSIQHYFELLKPLLLNVPSLVEANLDYDGGGDNRWDYGYVTAYKEEEEVLKGFILNLSHVNELKIGVSCSKALFRLKAEGFVFPSNLRVPEGFERVENGYL